ncbi:MULTISPECIES: c-type cytochrome [unclassified Caulobacter]|uniref:c-type cytochrome n=1 Tax=unclassified Caulobacter TaxID=2648921 RepID=UPI0004A6DDB0|nr:c-type cytochrome [Caulobacter sp. UNC358MFTsu5.1]
MKTLRSKPMLSLAMAAMVVCVGASPAAAQTKAGSAKTKAVQAKAPPAPPGDIAAGKAVFEMRCAMCHASGGAGGPMAPRLVGVYGAKAGGQPNFKYSSALTTASPQWNAANLDAFLAKPQGFVPGTRMMIATPKPDDRRNLIAYLASLRK